MIEIVNVDGKQFELTTEYPLTEQQRQQTISDIRRQTGCTSCNKTRSLDGSIQTLATDCVDITVQAPANISVTDVTITDETCSAGTCGSITCDTFACDSIIRDVVVTFTNTGDIAATVAPTLAQTVNGTPITMAIVTPPAPVLIPANSTNTATFGGVTLNRGANHICSSYT